MEELEDYSGEFNPDLKLTDFSKETLIRMWKVAAKLYIQLDGLWHDLVKERYGAETANELSRELWQKATPVEAARAAGAVNITGNDLAAAFKTWQVDPGGAGILDMSFELKDKTHGVLTVNRCKALDYYERHNTSDEDIRHYCDVIDREGFEDYAKIFNPNIKIKALSVPPRKDREGIACQWEFSIEE